MAYKLISSQEAHRDIDEIVAYIALVLKNAQAARDFLDDVEKSYRGVANNPFMYGLCADERLQREGYRKIPIKNYLVIYRVDESQGCVFVARVIYGARNYAHLL